MPRTFVYFLENVDSPTRDAIASHVAYLRALDDRGALIVCGPFRQGGGGMVVIEATSTEEARAIAAGDPFVVHGFKRFELREFARATAANHYLLDG